jgi:pyruvate,orthophosphate dikinase
MAEKWVYLFQDVEKAEASAGSWEGVRGLLGGKGANLAEMTRIGVPVPPGFTITTRACNAYLEQGGRFPEGMWDQTMEALKVVEERAGKGFGDSSNPLLVSCRSGAKFSMPGMMDTVLNIGLNDETAEGMIKLTDDPRFVYDAYRRLVQMFGSVVLGLPDEAFEEPMDKYKREHGYKVDTELKAALDSISLRIRWSRCAGRRKLCSSPGTANVPWTTVGRPVSPTIWERR